MLLTYRGKPLLRMDRVSSKAARRSVYRLATSGEAAEPLSTGYRQGFSMKLIFVDTSRFLRVVGGEGSAECESGAAPKRLRNRARCHHRLHSGRDRHLLKVRDGPSGSFSHLAPRGLRTMWTDATTSVRRGTILADKDKDYSFTDCVSSARCDRKTPTPLTADPISAAVRAVLGLTHPSS